MYFDVNDRDLDDLLKLDLDDGDELWQFTKQCISLGGHMNVYKAESGRENLDLVMGKLVHNPTDVEKARDEPEAFDDERKQFASLRTRRRLASLSSMSTLGRTMNPLSRPLNQPKHRHAAIGCTGKVLALCLELE
jgi:hypothetical protein